MSRSLHISYEVESHETRKEIRGAIISLVSLAASSDGIPPASFSIMDGGCGVGLLMRDLQERGFTNVSGMDLDANCVDIAGKYGNCVQGDLRNLADAFEENSFDLVILSHVLEHMDEPVRVLSQAKLVSRRWVVVVVPNPLRPMIQMKYALRSKNYSNLGHYYSWDRSHFTNFLTRYNGLKLVQWASDGIRIIPFTPLRKLFRLLGLLDLIENRLLPRCFSYFSSSLIVLCEPSTSMPETDADRG